MRFAVVLLVLLPCIALGGFSGLFRKLFSSTENGCGIPGGVCKKAGENLSKENLELVNWGVNQVISRDNSLRHFSLKKVNSYSSQVVAGMKYEFDVTLHNVEGDKRNVVFKIFDQPWTKTRELTILKNVVKESKKKNDGCNMPGGLCKKTGELSTEAQELLKWAVKTAHHQANSLKGFKLEKVNSHSTQVVAGIMYEFDVVLVKGDQKRNAVLKVWHQTWSGLKQLTIVKNELIASEVKPAEVDGCKLAGGVCKQTGDLSNTAQEILTWGIQQAATQENSLQGFKLEKVNSHSTQVVAGFNYGFDVILVNAEGQKRHVEIKVFDQSWTKTRKLTILKNELVAPAEVDGCKLKGGVCKQTGDIDNDAQEILTWGLQQAATQENALQGFKLEKVNSHSKQVVSGFNYGFDVILVNAEGQKRHVEIKVYDQSWTKTRKLTILKNEAI